MRSPVKRYRGNGPLVIPAPPPSACVEHPESKYNPCVNEQLRSVPPVAEDHFESPRLEIERARELVDEVKAGIKAFFDRRPYAKVVDFDDETGQQVHKVRLTAKLPGRIKTLVKDIAENLRSALDHAVYGSARALGVDDPRYTGFPFAETPAGVLGELGKERLQGNPPRVIGGLRAARQRQSGVVGP